MGNEREWSPIPIRLFLDGLEMVSEKIRFHIGRELSLEEILSYSIRIYRRSFVNLFVPYLILGAVYGALNYWAISALPPSPIMDIIGPEALIDWIIHLSTIILIVGLIGWILNVMVQGYSVKYSSTLITEETLRVKEAAGQAIRKLPKLIAASLIANLLIGVGLLLFIVPGVILAVMFSLIIPVITLEDRKVLEGLSRSKRLVSKRWGKTLLLLLTLVAVILTTEILGSMIAVALDPVGYAISIIATAIVEPIYPVAITCLYYSMKAKESAKEGKPKEMRPRALPVKYCIECGSTLSPIAVYCPRCGARQPSDMEHYNPS